MEESILKVLAKLMTEKRLENVVLNEKEYIKKDMTVAKLEAQLRGHDLTKEERLAVDRLLSASNESNVRYSQLAYEQGPKDIISILRELDLIKAM